MTKTKRNILLTFLSILLVGCVLLLSTVSLVSARADSISTAGLIPIREFDYRDGLFDRQLRMYEDSEIGLYGEDGEVLFITFNEIQYAGDEGSEPVRIELEIEFNDGTDDRGNYKDFCLTRGNFSGYFANLNAIDYNVLNVYILVEDIDFFEGKTFIEGGYVQVGDSLANKYVRYYVNGDVSAMETDKYYISMYTDEVVPQNSHVAEGYIDFYFPTDRLNENNLIVKNFIDNYDEYIGESTAFVYLEISDGEIDNPEDIPTDEPEVPSDKPIDKPTDEPMEEPTEKPDVKKEIDVEKLIMFGASGLLLLATLAFIISLFKKKK